KTIDGRATCRAGLILSLRRGQVDIVGFEIVFAGHRTSRAQGPARCLREENRNRKSPARAVRASSCGCASALSVVRQSRRPARAGGKRFAGGAICRIRKRAGWFGRTFYCARAVDER